MAASLASCGGGSSGSVTPAPPPPNGGSSGGSGGGSNGGAPAAFFGMHASSTVLSQQPWPQVSFGSLRLWDTATNWNQINIANGVYDFSLLDQWLSTANQHGVQDLLYTFGKTPQWASSRPNDQRCANDWGPGACDPPDDLNPDGSGSDQHWKDFVSALATHVGTSIKYWEIWNEPSSSNHWTGTVAQMVRMAQD